MYTAPHATWLASLPEATAGVSGKRLRETRGNCLAARPRTDRAYRSATEFGLGQAPTPA
jgi:hypothetical protein